MTVVIASYHMSVSLLRHKSRLLTADVAPVWWQLSAGR